MSSRKLPPYARAMNFIYQVAMILLGAVNIILTYLTSISIDIPTLYFEICSIGVTVLPVVWSKILDQLKECTDETPPSPKTNNEITPLINK